MRPTELTPIRAARPGEQNDALVQRLCEASVRKHFDAYEDIDWDAHPIDPNDRRWELPDDAGLGATAWYQSQPAPVRSRMGLEDIANHMLVGIEFEGVLKRGLLEFAATCPLESPSWRYAYHEVIEEAQHSLMFGEFVKRSGAPSDRLNARHAAVTRRIAHYGHTFPELFFVFVLAGEEPIDFVQRQLIGSDREVNPLLERIMRIHITEEVRHLCFAREFLKVNVPRLGRLRMMRLQASVPMIIGSMVRVMLSPSDDFIARFDIPKSVVAEAITNSVEHRRAALESIASVRRLCEELGILTKATKPLWRAVGLCHESLPS